MQKGCFIVSKHEWIHNFFDLYLSGNFKEAYKVKWENKPGEGKLYQYRSLKTAASLAWLFDLIKTGRMYHAPVDELNDPFDTDSILNLDRKKLTDYLEDGKAIKREWFEQILALPTYEETNRNADWYNNELKDAFIALDAHLKKWGNPALAVRKFNTRLSQLLCLLKVASFTEKNDNLTMWSHYADNHKGVCLEFSIRRLDKKIFNEGIFPVRYENELPNALDFLFNSLKSGKAPSYGVLSLFCAMHKLDSWSYEEEWRSISMECSVSGNEIMSANYVLSKIEGSKEDFCQPSRIILGHNYR